MKSVMKTAIPLLLSLLACAPEAALDTAYTPTWSADVQPIMQRACVRCHARGGPLYGGVMVDSYEATAAAAVKNACTALAPELVDAWGEHLLPLAGTAGLAPCEGWEVASMPPGATSPLTPDEQLVLVRWIAAGTPW